MKGLVRGLFDSHCHLDKIIRHQNCVFANISDLLAEEACGNLEGVLHVTCSKDGVQFTKELLEKKHEGIHFSFGCHPMYAKDWDEEFEKQCTDLISHGVSWGECGLDYYRMQSEKALQLKVFEKQLQLSQDFQKPLVIHTRQAEEDTFEMLKNTLPLDYVFHIHCFTDSLSFMEKVLNQFPNCVFGFTGVVTFKNAKHNRRLIEACPLNRLVLETDGPFMAPEPWRGQTSLPWMVISVAETVAKVKKISVDRVLEQTRENVHRIYGIYDKNILYFCPN